MVKKRYQTRHKSVYLIKVKANNKCMKDYDKNKESLHLKYWDVNNLYRWTMSRRLPSGGFKWVEETSQFNGDYLKSYNDDNGEGYFAEEDAQYPKSLI